MKGASKMYCLQVSLFCPLGNNLPMMHSDHAGGHPETVQLIESTISSASVVLFQNITISLNPNLPKDNKIKKDSTHSSEASNYP